MRPKTLATFVTVLTLAAGLSAQHESAQHDKKADAATVTGAWNMSLQGDHVIPVGMELTQEGEKVSGKILMPTQHIGERKEIALTGDFVDGALKLAGNGRRRLRRNGEAGAGRQDGGRRNAQRNDLERSRQGAVDGRAPEAAQALSPEP